MGKGKPDGRQAQSQAHVDRQLWMLATWHLPRETLKKCKSAQLQAAREVALKAKEALPAQEALKFALKAQEVIVSLY